MALTRKKMTKPDPGKLYVCWQSVAADVGGVPYQFSRGTRLRGSHPMVQALGALAFVEDGVPPTEWPSEIDAAIEQLDAQLAAEAKAAPPPTPPRIDGSTPLRDLWICTRGVVDSAAGPAKLNKIVHRRDPLLGAAPEAFAPLIERLGT